MNSKTFPLHLLSLLAVATACGSDPVDAPTDDPSDARPRVEQVTLQELSIISADAPAVQQPIRVQLAVDVTGEDFSGDVLVGLTDGEGVGCILGAMELAHSGETSETTLDQEFFVGSACAPLVGRDDVELFAAFDPWEETSYAARPDATGAASMFEAVHANALDVADCEACDVATAVAESPGQDAQLRELGLDTTVAVLDVSADPEVDVPGTGGAPHFAVSNRLRVTGLDKGESMGAEAVGMQYRIRPLPGTDAHAELDANAQQFVTLLSRRGEDFRALAPVDATGQIDHAGAAAVYIADEARTMMSHGAWADVEEFELEACVVTDFDEAVFAGESGARDNNCGTLPVVVVRRFVTEDGPIAQPSSDHEGAAKAREADAWSTGWSTSNGNLGTTGFDFSVWVDINSSDTATSTYGGRSVAYAGSWFEAGALATGTVFDYQQTLADIYASFIAYNGGGGAVYMGANLLGYDFISPIAINTDDGITLTLQDILDAAGSSAEPVFSKNISIVGFSFDDGCGSVNAGVWANGQIGIDTEETSITLQVVPGSTTVTGVFNPYASVAAEAGTTVNYGDFIEGSLVASVDLVRVDVPFTASAQLNYNGNGMQSLVFNQGADLELSALAGNITFSTKWKGGCFLFFCSGDVTHDHELVSWDGLSTSFPLFNASQTIDLGPGVDWNPGVVLSAGNSFTSSDGQSVLVMQGDGNLVVYTNGSPTWASGTAGQPGAIAAMQGDGNLVIYLNGVAIWASHTWGNPGAKLTLRNGGTFQIVAPNGTVLYSSH